MRQIKRIVFLCSLFAISHAPVLAEGFKVFNALSGGRDCKIKLDFPNGDFCGQSIPVDSVRSWYYAGGREDMLLGQKYNYSIIINSEEGIKEIPVQFLFGPTAKRFYVQMGAWTGKQSTHGSDSPFPRSWPLAD